MAPCHKPSSGAGAASTTATSDIKVKNVAAASTIDEFQWPNELLNVLKNANRVLISRHGESLHNLHGKIGGNSSLSEKGWNYGRVLAKHVNGLRLSNLKIWTSELTRTQQTAQYLNGERIIRPGLNEIVSGDHDSLTYEAIAEKYPIEFARRDQDKLRYRYPSGESYIDVCRRLVSVLSDIKPDENLIIISHQAVIRCILSAIQGISMEELPYVNVPLHYLLKVEFHKTGQHVVQKLPLKVQCVDTYRHKPKNCRVDRGISDATVGVPFHI